MSLDIVFTAACLLGVVALFVATVVENRRFDRKWRSHR